MNLFHRTPYILINHADRRTNETDSRRGDGPEYYYYLIRTGLETRRIDCDHRWFSNLIQADGP